MGYQREFLALIVEDDPLSALKLKDLITDHFPHIRVIGIAQSLQEAKTLLKCITIDLLFLDIELPDGNGFDLLSPMPEVHFEVIVTTAHSKYALEAIRNSALDFLVKPVTQDDLAHALERFTKKYEDSKPSLQEETQPDAWCRKLPLPTQEGFVFINFEDIVHAEAYRAYSIFSFINRAKVTVSKPLGDFEERLLNRNFFRVHKSYIINLDQVLEYIRGKGGYVVMTGQEIVPVSRNRKEDFLKAIGSL
ncbi:MAG TPA: LytTR family DNA-binding domain-containing protein [Bacteroidales bacterium]|nr:LytTR family DNA-binding domain-containing protein [Bacteroidales bacterium]